MRELRQILTMLQEIRTEMNDTDHIIADEYLEISELCLARRHEIKDYWDIRMKYSELSIFDKILLKDGLAWRRSNYPLSYYFFDKENTQKIHYRGVMKILQSNDFIIGKNDIKMARDVKHRIKIDVHRNRERREALKQL